MRLWENPNGIPSADISWLKEDTERGLFTPVQHYKDIAGLIKRRRVMKSDRMWFYPPEPPGYVSGALPNPRAFFRSRVFVWRPVGVWRCSLKCPRGDECVGRGRNVHLSKSGYHHRVKLTSPVLVMTLHWNIYFVCKLARKKRAQKVVLLLAFIRFFSPLCTLGTSHM